jgi:pyruvate,orthophosphate dikinase
MQMAVNDGPVMRPNLEVEICGGHGSHPSSSEFCHLIGNNCGSFKLFRDLVARMAAADAAIKHSK